MPDSQRGKHKVYIVDDDESVRRALGRLLRSAGLDHQAFGSGEEFFADAADKSSGCLVLDLQMPLMSGNDLLARLRSRGMTIPVIALSAQDDSETRERARDLGAVVFFRKPVDDQALLDAIQWALGPRTPIRV